MLIGILSDSHGRADRTTDAVRTLCRTGAQALVHCGDIGDGPHGQAVLDALACAGVPAHFVWGNNDWPAPGGRPSDAYVRQIGLTPPGGTPLDLELGGRKLWVFHGHEPAFQRLLDVVESPGAAAPAGVPGLVLYGHSHIAADDRRGPVRFINPGALHRAARYTCCTLDLATGRLDLIAL